MCGKEGEVLVPAHLAFALGRRFPVQLAVLQAQILADELRHRTQHHRMPRGHHKSVIEERHVLNDGQAVVSGQASALVAQALRSGSQVL